jgi:hypothetical protein
LDRKRQPITFVRKRTDYSSACCGAEQILVCTEWALTKKLAETGDSAFGAGGASAVMLIVSAFPIDDGKDKAPQSLGTALEDVSSSKRDG